ncbi:MAG: sigma factor, partial [Acidobacteriota bacterium]
MNTGQLYDKLGNQLKYFIGKRVSDPVVVEDILHDVFIKIHNNIHLLKNSSKLESWVFQI